MALLQAIGNDNGAGVYYLNGGISLHLLLEAC
jgi:hypothetical protein